jgi:hypothetical protein
LKEECINLKVENMIENDYITQLRDLVHQINTNVGPLTTITAKNLDTAKRLEPPFGNDEKKLLLVLIDKGREYIQLKKIASRHFLSKDLFEQYFSLSRWFNSLQMLLDTFEVPLYKISFDELCLKE